MGDKFPVIDMFDIDGDETDDPYMAMRVVCLFPDGSYKICECAEGEIVPQSKAN